MIELQKVGKNDAITMLRRRELELSFELPEKAVERFSTAFYPRDGMAVERSRVKEGIEFLFQCNLTDLEMDAINPLLLDLPSAQDLENSLATFGAAGPIGRFVRRTTLRENKRGPLIFRPCPAKGTGKFWDAEDIETGFRTLSGRFLGSCKAETQPPLKRTI